VIEIDRDVSEIVRGRWRLAYGCMGERGSPGMVRAGEAVDGDLSAFGEQIGKGCARLGRFSLRQG